MRVRFGVGVTLTVLAVLFWWAATAARLVSPLIIPTPSATWSALLGIATPGSELYIAVIATVTTIAIAFGPAVLVGVLLGQVIGRIPLARDAYEPLFAHLAAVPFIVLYPMLVGALGVSRLPGVIVGAIAAVLPILLAAISSARTVDPSLVTALRALGAGPLRRATAVILPATVPALFSGMRTGLGLCGVTVVAAEYIASLDGLGYHLAQTSQSLQTPALFAYLIATLVVMGVLNLALGTVGRIVTKGVHR